MMKVRMESTTEYERLVKFFIQQGLEYDEDEKDFSNVLHAWKITQTGDYLVAGHRGGSGAAEDGAWQGADEKGPGRSQKLGCEGTAAGGQKARVL